MRRALILGLISACALRSQDPADVVISQIYGGGGNAGATVRSDFIELFNRGTAPVSITGWSVQYASAAGANWDRTILSGTIAPGGYYLIELAQGNGGAVSLPAPDARGSVDLSATSGKVALVNNAAALAGAFPSGPQIIDFVGYGSANAAEGAPAPALSNMRAAIRGSGGCRDTNRNEADFTSAPPAPRNSQSALSPCAATQTPQVSEAGITNAASLRGGAIAPGEIVTISGSGLGPPELASAQLTPDGRKVATILASTRVLFDGVAAPILYTVSNQVRVVVPLSVATRDTITVQVEYAGRLSNRAVLPVAQVAPGIFTAGASGQASAANEDGTLNGAASPAPPGSIVVLYATGAGRFVPETEDGTVITGEPPRPALPVSVRIGGIESEVVYAGAAPGQVLGVLQINARVPRALARSPAVPVLFSAGSATSQDGVTIAVAGPPDGTGPLIEDRLADLMRNAVIAPLAEIPTDKDPIPPGWLGIVSWNTQVGGTSVAAGAPRPPLVQSALAKLFTGTFQLLAAQEVPSLASANLLNGLLPGGPAAWRFSFFDTNDTMDNGFWFRAGITLRDAFPLFAAPDTASPGRWTADSSKSLHPPQVAQFQAGDFDFTMITLHLTFAGGNTLESAREMREILNYLDWYFNQPDHDPDVLVCGDFNMPSNLSGQAGTAGLRLEDVFAADPRFQTGERRFVTTVHEPTSRASAANGGRPASNYDHCVLSADTLEEFIQARRVSTEILTEHPDDPEARLTSDHFPIAAFFRTSGENVSPDSRMRIRP
jgi:uncharacterized protein (TIGR03437 family)